MKYQVLSSKCLKNISVGIILYACFFILNTETASAEAVSLRVSPTLLQLRTEEVPYVSTTPITIENLSENGVNLRPQIKLFKAGEDGNGQIEYLNDNSKSPNLLKFIQISDDRGAVNELTLGPKQKKKLQLRISLPTDQKPSDYYFSLIFISKRYVVSQDSTSTDKNSFSTISAGVAMNTILSIGPRTNQNLSIDEFSTSSFKQNGPIPFTVKIKNNGSQLVSPTGMVFIKNMFGQTIGKVDIPTQNILAHSSRYLDTNSLNPNSYPTTPKVVWNENFLLGPYTAELKLDLAEGKTLTHKTKFFAFPAKLAILTLLITILTIVIIKRVKLKISEN